jgi:hypothetical protein
MPTNATQPSPVQCKRFLRRPLWRVGWRLICHRWILAVTASTRGMTLIQTGKIMGTVRVEHTTMTLSKRHRGRLSKGMSPAIPHPSFSFVCSLVSTKRQRTDQRTRVLRNRSTAVAWKEQMPTLITTYLHWKHKLAMPDDHAVGAHIFNVKSFGIQSEYKYISNLLLDVLTTHLVFCPSAAIPQRNEEGANTSLIHVGLLGSSPQQPTTAFLLEFLKWYTQIHQRQSSFSVQAITKVLCSIHNVSFFSS